MALVDLDSDTWRLLARFNLFWASVFSIASAASLAFTPDRALFVGENILLAGVFGFLWQYCSLGA